ncbi:hypothetical protein ACTXT7_010061 [Hymenolepis weldensis]
MIAKISFRHLLEQKRKAGIISPGSLRVVTKTSSAGKHPKSSLMVFLIASRMIGKHSDQSALEKVENIADGSPSEDIQDSTSPLAIDSEEVSHNGAAIDQSVKRPIQVKMCLKNWMEGGDLLYLLGYPENEHQAEKMKRVDLEWNKSSHSCRQISSEVAGKPPQFTNK